MDVLSLLGSGEWVSGEMMAGRLSISRSAVWKQIQILRKRGYAISSSTRKGYRLTESPDLLNADQISGCLKTEWMGRRLKVFDSVPSTNAVALSLANSSPHGTVILAETQSEGRGRLSRTWASPPGGIWMSLILKPQMPLSEVGRINMAVSVALCRAIWAVLAIESGIKWPNDIMIGERNRERKVCGVLTEMKAEVDRVDYVVVGLGLNANVDVALLPEDWRATSLAREAGRTVPRAELICRILEEAELAFEAVAPGSEGAQEIYQEWRSHCITLNRRVRITGAGGDLVGRAADLAEDGALILKMDDGVLKRIVAGDCIHLRPLEDILTEPKRPAGQSRLEAS